MLGNRFMLAVQCLVSPLADLNNRHHQRSIQKIGRLA
jgi:hypothetical protein